MRLASHSGLGRPAPGCSSVEPPGPHKLGSGRQSFYSDVIHKGLHWVELNTTCKVKVWAESHF